MFDTHAHLTFEDYKGKEKEIARECLRRGMKVVSVGSNYDSSASNVQLSKVFEKDIYCSIGIHPSHLCGVDIVESGSDYKCRQEIFDKSRFQDLLKQGGDKGVRKRNFSPPKVVAIGEIGLDYNTISHLSLDQKQKAKEAQKQGFKRQLNFAMRNNLPVILHIRDEKGKEEAIEDVYQNLKRLEACHPEWSEALKGQTERRIPWSENHSGPSKNTDVSSLTGSFVAFQPASQPGNAPQDDRRVARGVVHCFIYNWSWAQKFLDLGFYLGFTGIITYDETPKISGGQKKRLQPLLEVVRKMPQDKILVETDAPFLVPEPIRSQQKEKINKPWYVEQIIKKIVKERGENLKEVEDYTSENAKRLFGV